MDAKKEIEKAVDRASAVGDDVNKVNSLNSLCFFMYSPRKSLLNEPFSAFY